VSYSSVAHIFYPAGPPRWVNCLAPRWEITLSVVQGHSDTLPHRERKQSFDYWPSALPTEPTLPPFRHIMQHTRKHSIFKVL